MRAFIPAAIFALGIFIWSPQGTAQVTQGFAATPLQTKLSETQKMIFEASKYMMARDFRTAESIYSQVIARDPNHITAYLQRGLARRELADATGTASDGRTVVTLANATLERNAYNSTLYYQRSMGLRLLKRYPEAMKDMEYAIRLSGKSQWQTDLQAIELEQKMTAQ